MSDGDVMNWVANEWQVRTEIFFQNEKLTAKLHELMSENNPW